MVTMEDVDRAYEEMMIEYRKYCMLIERLYGDDE